MNTTTLTTMLQTKYRLSRRHSRQVLDDIFDTILEEASRGKPVTIRGIGTFRLVDPKPKKIPKHPGATTMRTVDPPPTIRFALSEERRKKLQDSGHWWWPFKQRPRPRKLSRPENK